MVHVLIENVALTCIIRSPPKLVAPNEDFSMHCIIRREGGSEVRRREGGREVRREGGRRGRKGGR